MKRKSCSPRIMPRSHLSLFDDDELEVSEILLQMPRIILESDNRSHFPFSWGVTKKRSAIDPSLSLPSGYPSSSSYHLGTCVSPTCDNDDPIRNVEAPIPMIPLSFSPNKPDGKSKRPTTNVSYKKTKEDWLKKVKGLSNKKELLKREIENVMRLYNTLKALNSELKAKKQQLNLKAIAEAKVESREQVHPQQPLPLLHHSAQASALVPCTAGSDVANPVGPCVIPDLNVSPEEPLGPDSQEEKASGLPSEETQRPPSYKFTIVNFFLAI